MKRLIPSLFAILLLFTGCLDNFSDLERERVTSLPRELTPSEQQIIQSDKQFGVDLFRNLAGEEDGNIFISPLSISMALGMTLNGAAGETREGMMEALRKSGLDMRQINESYRGLLDMLPDLDPGVKMRIANAVWYRQPEVVLRDTFMADTRRYFDAEVQGLDFDDPSAVETINGWVDEKTEGLIPTIIQPPIPSNVITYLMNAIYFKGDWMTPFDTDRTSPGTFHTASGEEVEVDMMTRSYPHEQVPVFHSDAVIAADIAYGDSLYSMTLLMPADPRQTLDDFIQEEFTAANLETWTGNLAGKDKIRMPKFEVDYKITLNQILASMGMEEAFSGSADFSNMYEKASPYIERVDHKTYIKVDEKGTEAAAVTNVVMVVSGPVPFDRPFVYLIRERLSGTLLFIGRMNDPTSG